MPYTRYFQKGVKYFVLIKFRISNFSSYKKLSIFDPSIIFRHQFQSLRETKIGQTKFRD